MMMMTQMLTLQKQQQEPQFEQQKQQQKFLELLLNKTSEERTPDSFTPDAIANSISEIVYNPDNGTIFPAYYKR